MKEKIEEFLDSTSTDAVALAIKRGTPLWTDDLGLQRLLVELGAGVSTVWTQAVMRAAMGRSRIIEEIYELVLGRLLDCGYAFTRLSAPEMLAVLRHADWRIDSGVGEALIRVVSGVALTNPHNRLITSLFMKGVWTACPRREWAKTIIVAILERIGRERSQTTLSAFIYRFRGLQRPGVDRDRALKRFLTSWRPRDGEFKPR